MARAREREPYRHRAAWIVHIRDRRRRTATPTCGYRKAGNEKQKPRAIFVREIPAIPCRSDREGITTTFSSSGPLDIFFFKFVRFYFCFTTTLLNWPRNLSTISYRKKNHHNYGPVEYFAAPFRNPKERPRSEWLIFSAVNRTQGCRHDCFWKRCEKKDNQHGDEGIRTR